MNRVIVFGGNHVNTLGLIRSLGRCGLPVICILHCDRPRDCSLRFSKYLCALHVVPSAAEGIALLQARYGSEADKPILLFSSDDAVLAADSRYAELKDRFRFFNARGEISRYMNKSETFPLAEAAGLNLIRTQLLPAGAPVPEGIGFPCLIKGNNSTTSSKADSCICRNEAELRTHLREGADMLLQEYIEKEYEINLVGLSCEQGKTVFIPSVIRKIRDDMHRQSVVLRMDSLADYPLLNLEQVHSFIQALGYEGIFSVEFLYRAGTYYFLEVNLRNDGCGYFYTAAGANYPRLWVRYCQGHDLSGEIAGIRVKTPYYLSAFDDIKNMLEGKVSFFVWLRDLLRSDVFFCFDLRDPLPACHALLIHLRQACRRVVRV